MAGNPTTPNPPLTPFGYINASGKITVAPEWWRFLNNLNNTSGDAVAGEVATAPGSGLTGGGQVADGVNLSIAAGGVSNAMLRQGQPCSVIGRYGDSTGTVADILAVADNTVLTRDASSQLGFTPYLDGIAIGLHTPAPSITVETHTPATAGDTGTAGTIAWDADYLYVCVATDSWKRVAIAAW
jgi:hypothetical protein